MRHLRVFTNLVIITVVVSWLTACGGGGGGGGVAPPAQNYSRFSFVANLSSDTVDTFATDSVSGGMKLTSTAQTGVSPTSVFVHPDNQSAYVTNLSDNTVSQYTVSAQGVLIPMSPATVATGTGPNSLTIDPGGNFAYVTTLLDNSVSQYTVNANGSLSLLISAPTVATGMGPGSISIDSASRYAYVANQTSDDISQYTIGTDGGLIPMSTPLVMSGGSTPARPARVVIGPSDAYAYVVNAANDSVGQFVIGGGGALTPMTTATVATGGTPTSMAIDSQGRYAYVSNGGGTVSQYNIAADGSLVAMTTPTVTAGAGALSIQIDVNDQNVYVLNSSENTMSQYRVTADGSLQTGFQANVPAKVATGGTPFGMAAASGNAPLQAVSKLAYVSNSTDASVSQYTVGADGSLVVQAVATVPVSTGAAQIRVHPNGQYVYAVEFDTVDQFRISDTGSLVSLLPASVSTGASTTSIDIHPGGEHAYVINNVAAGTTILQYAINADGTLSLIGTFVISAVDVGATDNAARIAIDPSGRYAYVGLGGGEILQFSVGTDGLLMPLATPSIPVVSTVFAVNIHPGGHYLYAAMAFGASDYRIAQFDIGSDGQLSPMVPAFVSLSGVYSSLVISFVPGTITPTGDFFYLSLGGNGIDQFQIDNTGHLTPLTPQNFPANDSGIGAVLNGISLDASGQYAYIPNTLTDMVDQYRINADGSFADHAIPAVATGSGPMVIGIQNRYE